MIHKKMHRRSAALLHGKIGDQMRNVLLARGKLDVLDDCLSISKTKFDKIAKTMDPETRMALAQCMTQNYSSGYITTKKVTT